MTERHVTLEHYDSARFETVVDDLVVPLYEATHADVIHDPFYSSDRFVERVRGYLKAPGFESVLGTADGGAVGLAFGYPLPENARWWNGLTTPVEPEEIQESGRRTFGLCELMVHPQWQRRGIARSIHDELLHKRPESRASLLVREDNTAANEAYAKWGWTRFGKLQPYPDSPHYDVLVLTMPS